jgi:hypothetical protein
MYLMSCIASQLQRHIVVDTVVLGGRGSLRRSPKVAAMQARVDKPLTYRTDRFGRQFPVIKFISSRS